MDAHSRPHAHDELVHQLLNCGGVLSQIISHMVKFEASGKSAPDAVPIPEMAHSLIRDVTLDPIRDYSKRDVRVAARIVKEVTEAICRDIYAVNPDFIGDPELN